MPACELRISDWSSDVCSSALDVHQQGARGVGRVAHMHAPGQAKDQPGFDRADREPIARFAQLRTVLERPADLGPRQIGIEQQSAFRATRRLDRTSVVEGTRVYVRGGRGGRRKIKKKNK